MDYTRILIFFALGLLIFFRPDLVWKFERLVFFKQGDQPESHRKITAFGGIVLIVAAVVMVVLHFI